MEYSYALRGDGQGAARVVDGGRQRRALETILGILVPERLDLPDSVLGLLLPRTFESERNREMFASTTAPAFDALGAAATAADQVVEELLQLERLGRLIDFHRRDPSVPGPQEIFGALLERAFAPPAEDESPRHGELRQTVRRVVVDRWLDLAADPETGASVRAYVEQTLRRVRQRLPAAAAEPEAASAYDLSMAADIDRFLARTDSLPSPARRPAPLPPGSPIGGSPPALAACGSGG